MDEWFLQEQLNRIQAMSERMSEARRRAAEMSEQVLRDRDSHKGAVPPLKPEDDVILKKALELYSSPQTALKKAA